MRAAERAHSHPPGLRRLQRRHPGYRGGRARTPTLSAKCISILAAHSGQTFEKVKRDADRDFYMTAQEAKDYGIIDEGAGASAQSGLPCGSREDASLGEDGPRGLGE